MKAAFSQRFIRQYADLSVECKARFDKQLAFLLTNLRHPSLRTKKYDEASDIWQAPLDENYRFCFWIEGDTYRLLSIIPHPKQAKMMMSERAARGSKAKALGALAAVREADRPPLPEDRLTLPREKHRGSPGRSRRPSR